MDAVEPEGLIALHQVDHIARTPNASDDNVVRLWDLMFGHMPLKRPLQSPTYAEVAAARAPNEVVFWVAIAQTKTFPFSVLNSATRAAMRSTRVAGLNGSPVYCVTDSAR